jgi:phosphoglycolate phosphatase
LRCATEDPTLAAVRAYLFDMDGTIVDSLGDIGGSMNHVLAELGLPTHAIDDYKEMVGEGARALIERALPPGREDLHDEALRRYKARYATHLVVTSRPYEGIVALLEALAARGHALGVVTNKPHGAAQGVVDALFRRGTFGVVIGEREGLPRKPDPAPALAAAEALGGAAGDCVFVGDTSVDMATARAAGMTSVGVLWGFRGRGELEAAGARHIVSHPAEILALP